MASRVPLAIAALTALAGLGCEGAPARSKPWRHERAAPMSEQQSKVSHLLEEEEARVEAHRNRDTTLRIHIDSRPGSLVPFYRPTEWARRIAMDSIFEPLVRYSPNANGSGGAGYRPGVLKSWSVSPDGREMRLEVREGQKFHDGRRLTSVDVQFSIDMARSRRGGADHLRGMLDVITAVELVSPRVVRVRLSKPSGYVLRAFAELPVVPAHIYAGQLRRSKLPVVGSGPYRLRQQTKRRIALERWPDYSGSPGHISDIVYVFEGDAAVALTAAKRGELDVIPSLIAAHKPSQAQAPAVVRNFRQLRLAPAELRYLVPNLGRAPLDDVRVRRALLHLVDRDTIANKLQAGLAKPAAGFVWPSGPLDGAAPPPAKFDPDEAGDWLDRAGWRRDGSGVRRRLGQRLKLDVLVTETPNDERDRILKDLRKAGIATELRIGPPGVLEKRLRDGEFDLAFVSSSGPIDRDLGPVLSSEGRLNYGRYRSALVDRLLKLLEAELDPVARRPIASQLAAQLARDIPIIPIVRPDPVGLVAKRVRGVVPWNGWFSVREASLDDTAAP